MDIADVKQQKKDRILTDRRENYINLELKMTKTYTGNMKAAQMIIELNLISY